MSKGRNGPCAKPLAHHPQERIPTMNTVPTPGQTLRFADGHLVAVVTSVGAPLRSGRFAGMHVVIYRDADSGREGTFIAEISRFVVVG